MSQTFCRRQFLTASAGSVLATAIAKGSEATWSQSLDPNSTDPKVITLQATRRTLDINGRAAQVWGLMQPDGTQGITTDLNQPFRVTLLNKLDEPTGIHWHGLHPPNSQDGVAGLTQDAIAPGESFDYDFALTPAGTHWMHSHHGFQEQRLLSAPLIVRDPSEAHLDEQEVVIILKDFSFRDPEDIFAGLRSSGMDHAGMGGMNMGSGMDHGAMMDLNDVEYDAYLANDCTLQDPDVVQVEPGQKVRLRLINAAGGTNFWINLGSLRGELIATDGMPVQPLAGEQFPIAVSQRIDIRLQLPSEGGAFPILAVREGSPHQTGIILATAEATIPQISEQASQPGAPLDLSFEQQLQALHPLTPKTSEREYTLRLGGSMRGYTWHINGQQLSMADPQDHPPLVQIKPGERVILNFVNRSMMSHPMHLHGHSFQVIEINGTPISGALRDSVLIPPMQRVKVAFDANNPGLWFIHCHIVWHLEAGMAALMSYSS